jgi:hypothetical protein
MTRPEKKSSLEYLVSFDDLEERELLRPCIVKCGNAGGWSFCLVYWAPTPN